MFRNYMKIAWRNLAKQKLYAGINLAGMSIGIACFILLILYIQYETSYDQQHSKKDRIFRISQKQEGNTFRGTDQFAVAPLTLAPAVKSNFPEVEAITTFCDAFLLFSKNNEVQYESGIYGDTSLFEIFDYKVIEGNPRIALRDRNSIVLTKSMAVKYFGTQQVIGQEIKTEGNRSFLVGSVIEDLPANQQVQFKYVLPLQNYDNYVEDRDRYQWASNNYWVYLLLAEGSDPQLLENKFSLFDDEVKKAYSEFPFMAEYFLEPLNEIYLHSTSNNQPGALGDIRYIYLASGIALIILILALINYMNLATARYKQRAKEVGMRKVLGANKKQVVYQLLMESMLLSLISILLALFLTNVFITPFNRLVDLEITFNPGSIPLTLIIALSFALALGILSGLYPAIKTSSLPTMLALKGKFFSKDKDGRMVGNFLLVGQFTAAIVLAICSLVIYQQFNYIHKKELGYKRNEVVYIPYTNQELFKERSVLKSELLKNPQVKKVSFSATLPLNSGNQGIVSDWDGHQDQEDIYIYRFRTDEDFVDLFEMELLEGRNLGDDLNADSVGRYILNQTAVERLGWQSAVGRSFADGQVVGVVKDFHFQPMDMRIQPMYITHQQNQPGSRNGFIIMRIDMSDVSNTVSFARSTVQKFMPDVPVDVQFLDEAYDQLYEGFQRTGRAFAIFTILALFIACIGLFGLVTHQVVLRIKEIGIRKILGATIPDILSMISRDFMWLILISAILAVPVSWYLMEKILENFAYRIDMPWMMFLLACLLSLALAFITISAQSLRAALVNPIECIKEE